MKGMTAPMKKITLRVIYLIKVNYTSYKSTWKSLKIFMPYNIVTRCDYLNAWPFK